MNALLEVKDLKVEFMSSRGTVRAVNGISFQVDRGETVAVVGESGCGKSVTAMTIMRLLEYEQSENYLRTGGMVSLDSGVGEPLSLLDLTPDQMQKVRGRMLAMIFQEPMTSLNPTLTIGRQLGEVIRYHQRLDSQTVRRMVKNLLEEVGIAAAESRMRAYPFQLSGGMRQRVMIAIALACRPKLLIADEPTTALDVTIQSQILYLLKKLQVQRQTALMFITHNMGIVAQIADRVMVMYAGHIVEVGPVAEVFRQPLHPYTKMLLQAVPRLQTKLAHRQPLPTIPGAVANPLQPPSGCPFHPRCPYVTGECREEQPPLETVSADSREVKCRRWQELKEGASLAGAFNRSPAGESVFSTSVAAVQ